MTFLHLFIVNKSGGLVYFTPLSDDAPKISTNEWLRIGSTFHSLHAIAAEASPAKLETGKNKRGADDGIEEIVAGNMMLRCLQTRTGLKFVITAQRQMPSSTSSRGRSNTNNNTGPEVMEQVLREIYILYTDCVLKDPFYELEMPIRSELFSQSIEALMEKVEKNNSGSLLFGGTSNQRYR